MIGNKIRFVLWVVLVSFAFGLSIGCSSSSDLTDDATVDSTSDANAKPGSDMNSNLDVEQDVLCNAECTTPGKQICNQAKTGYNVCGNHDSDPCLEWGEAITCGAGQACENGTCCTTDCTNRVCGPDPVCGASCGSCSGATFCNRQGQCVSAPPEWAISVGSPVFNHGHSIAMGSSGDLYVTGTHSKGSRYGLLGGKILIAKLTGDGQFIWEQSPENGEGMDVAVDTSGKVYVTGLFTDQSTFGNTKLTAQGATDIFVTKLSSTGQFEWVKQMGSTSSGYDKGNGIAVDASGNVYVTGWFFEEVDFGSTTLTSKGGGDAFVVKLSSSGQFLWAKSAGGSGKIGADSGNKVAVDNLDNAFVVGQFSDAVDFGSISLIAKDRTMSDIFVTKLSPSGQFVWAVSAGGTSIDRGLDIAVDKSGNPFVTGLFNDVADFGSTKLTTIGKNKIFLAKLSPAGQFLWAVSGGGGQSGALFTSRDDSSVALEATGDPYITGSFFDTASFGSTTLTGGFAVAKYASNGQFLWAESVNAYTSWGIDIDGNGYPYLIGDFSGTATFGNTTLIAGSTENIFIWKMDPP
ncbi:MAG: SBBP repeat-containing protein [Pseudomonadota bacterium]